MSCNHGCGSTSAISDVSAPLINSFQGSRYSPALTTLLHALDKVEMRMRTESIKVDWKPSQFPQRTVPYGQRPEGTEVVAKNTPLYFENNDEFSYDLRASGPNGGICEGESLCSEPPANQVPGDSYQRFTWRMKGTAWETPVFCLKDLLFYENGIETLRNFLKNVERTPFDYYDNYIRNLIWETGEKYILASTEVGLLWNSPDRVNERIAPNLADFKTYSPVGATADAAVPTLAGLQYLKYICEQHLGDDFTSVGVEGGRDLMVVIPEPDLYSIVYNDDTCGPCSFVEGGMGFSMFDFGILDRVPFAAKMEKKWFRGDFDDVTGEFYRIPMKVYVPQNGGQALVTNPAWLNAKYGVMTFMTARPFVNLGFETLPDMPSQIPEESKRYLRPRFQFAPKMETCNYTRGLVQWRAEDEFGFMPTGEKILHVIFRRDELSSYLRQAKAGVCVEEITDCRVPIPQTCPDPVPVSCCRTSGFVEAAVDYSDTSYTIEYNVDIITALGLGALPAAAQFQTIKGVFDGVILSANSTGTIVTFGVDPTQHDGGHFCCTDQLIGFVIGALPADECSVDLDAGLAPDPFDPTQFLGAMSRGLDAAALDVVAVLFDAGCGVVDPVDMTVVAIDNNQRRITLSLVTPADFPDGLPCADARKICAYNTVGCDTCIPAPEAACVPDAVTPIPLEEDEKPEGEDAPGGEAEVAEPTE